MDWARRERKWKPCDQHDGARESMWRMETYLDADLASIVVDDVNNALQSRNELVVPNAQATRKKAITNIDRG